MSKHSNKISRAAHIKQNTKGTSNEVSLSVLDAIKGELDGTKGDINVRKPGRIPLLRLSGRRKRGGTPEKEKGLTLPGGGFVSTEGLPQSNSRIGGIQLESSDKVTGSKKPKGHPWIVGGFSWARAFGRVKQQPHVGESASIKGSLFVEELSSTSITSEVKETSSAPIPTDLLQVETTEPLNKHRRWNERSSRDTFNTSQPTVGLGRTPEEEIAWRKARRRKGKALAVAAVCLMSVALAGGALWYGVRYYGAQQDSLADLNAALSLIEEADVSVLAFDEIVDDPVSAVSVSSTGSSGDSIEVVRTSEEGSDVSEFSIGEKNITIDASDLMKRRSDAVSAQRLLDDANKKAREASLNLTDADDREAANQAVVAIDARKTMIDQALKISEPTQHVAECSEVASEAWSRVIEGDKLARESAKLIEDATEENLRASKEMSEQAQALFDQAQALFEQARNLYEEVDFSSFEAYLNKRREAMGYAIASDVALIERNKEEAASQNDAYEACDAEAVSLAGQLPENPSEAVRETYDTETAPFREVYDTARMQAGTADAILRDYLGAQDK
ncbi:hypothetical protein [Adlercreutzia sp. ZJ138]|uniref:hypothetical protein n=1 Tax=Adlercreutzia sp. ZJ138 TaxID=2709405 RepID=UPI0013EA3DB3|nr:hypothetical protein [Adlercreutzia sp. ZJ138]